MEVDKVVTPRDAAYIGSLIEPWKSISIQAIPPVGTDPLPSATNRLDRLEIDMRSHMLQVLQDPTRTVQTVGEFWKSALDLCVHLVHHACHNEEDPRYTNMAARKLPLLLMEDCLDGLSLQESQEFWDLFVEPALEEVILRDSFWEESNVCHLPFLRVCNRFLKILETTGSRDKEEWKGRLLCVLSKGFTIADRSAFKHWGSFHATSTNFETEEEFDQRQVKSVSELDKYSLYQAFWSLQSDFSTPNRIQVADFIRKLKIVLSALESSSSKQNIESSSQTPTTSALRYMTSSSLLPTQLTAPEFRSSVISQFLIVASHLSSESLPLANALESLLLRARKLLQSDNPQLYSILWDSILSKREPNWRKWKKQKSPASAFAPKEKLGKDANDTTKARKRPRLLDGPLDGETPGNKEQVYELLGKDDLVKTAQELAKIVPTLEQHLEPYVEALDPEAGIEDEYHPKNDALFTWRAMRLYAKHQLPLLKHCRQPADLERITREWYKAQGKDIPGDMPTREDSSDDENSDSSADEKHNEEETPDGQNHSGINDPSADVEGDEEMEVKHESGDEGKDSLPEATARRDDEKKDKGDETDNGSKPEKKDDDANMEDSVELSPSGVEGIKPNKSNTGGTPDKMDEETNKDSKSLKNADDEKPDESKEQEGDEDKEDESTEANSKSRSPDGSEEKKKSPQPPKSKSNSRSSSTNHTKPTTNPPPRSRPSRDSDRGRDSNPRGGGRRDDDRPSRGGGGRRDDGPPPRRRGPPGRRDDGPPGRRDDGPPGRRRDDGRQRSVPPGRRSDNGPPGRRRDDGPQDRSGRGERVSGDRGPPRDDHRRAEGGGRRRSSRDDGRVGRRR